MVVYHPPKNEDFFITARLIIELMAPKPEVTTKALQDYVKSIENPEKAPEIRLLSYNVAEPKKQDGGTYTNFVEMDLKFASLASLIGYCFDALPSSIEIIEPDTFKLEGAALTGLLNDLQARLHKVNFELANLNGNYKALETNSVRILKNFIRHILKGGPLPSAEIQKATGLTEESLKGLIKAYIKPGFIEQKDGKYHLVK